MAAHAEPRHHTLLRKASTNLLDALRREHRPLVMALRTMHPPRTTQEY